MNVAFIALWIAAIPVAVGALEPIVKRVKPQWFEPR